MRRGIWIIILAGLLGACVTAPEALRGQFSAITPQQARAQNLGDGQRVRWGGEIINTTPGQSETCFEVLSRPLDEATSRPVEGDQVQGRFKACAPGFYDPGVFTKGRELTVTGSLGLSTTGKVGGFDYRYPQVMADTVYLWPPPPSYPAWSGYYYDDPFYSPFYRFRDPFFDPFFSFRRFRYY